MIGAKRKHLSTGLDNDALYTFSRRPNFFTVRIKFKYVNWCTCVCMYIIFTFRSLLTEGFY